MKTITTAIVGLMLVAAPASAQVLNPTVGSYSAPSASIQSQVTPKSNVSPTQTSTPAAQVTTTPTTPTATNSRALPFTGLQVGLIVLAGVALLGVGLGVRRVARGPQTS